MTCEHIDVVIIGAGFGGLAAAHGLLGAGFTDLAVLERARDVGGVWRANTYPGCACDVPSALYSLSFAPNPAWTRKYASQPEILRYQQDLAEHLLLRPRIRFGCRVDSCTWQEQSRRWLLATSTGTISARVVVAALGGLTVPAQPPVPGLAQFPGEVVHTAAWGGGPAVDGVDVAVVGTGASAIQVVPALQPRASRLTVFQRTPPWVLPRRDRIYPPARQRLLSALPALQQGVRLGTYAALESRAVAFVREPALMRVAERQALNFLRREVPDPVLRRRLTPQYRLGCKRALLSDDWYPALRAPNVEVVGGLREVRGRTLIASDGSAHRADTIVLATGFHVLDSPAWDLVSGRRGRTLGQVFDGSPRAYKGTTVAGFPNLFLITGPNTGLGHSSMIYMIESQVAYLVSALRGMRSHGVHDVEVSAQAQASWNTDLDRRLQRTVWARGGCSSYYTDRTGRASAVWPGFTFEFRRATRRFDPGAYLLRRPAGPCDG